MAQPVGNMKEKARRSAEKAVYVAVGAPTAVLKALSARVSDMRDTMKASRDEMSAEISSELDEWIAQGEDVIEWAMGRIRKSGATDRLRSSTRTARDAVRVGVDKATETAETGLDLVAPEEDLTAISGIGPGYARKLNAAGVGGISAFLDRTQTHEETRALATTSGLSSDLIESWRAQADLTRLEGVGSSYLHLLQRVGVWTLGQLANSEPAELARRMRDVDWPDSPDQIPSESQIAQWKAEAQSL